MDNDQPSRQTGHGRDDSHESDTRAELTWERVLPIWWSCYWRGVLYAGVIAIVVMSILVMIGVGYGIKTSATPIMSRISTKLFLWLCTLPAMMFGFKQGLERHLSSLRKS
jgi:hypothetical protein